jgi:hypothetical protein
MSVLVLICVWIVYAIFFTKLILDNIHSKKRAAYIGFFPTLPTEKQLPSFISTLQNAKNRPLIKTHVTPDLEMVKDSAQRELFHFLLPESDHVYVVRDGRDVMVSYFYFQKKFSSTSTNFSDYLRSPQRMDHRTVVKYWVDHVIQWRELLGQEKFIYFESLRQNMIETVTSLGHSLGLTRNHCAIEPINMDKQRIIRAFKCALGIQQSTAVLPGYGNSNQWASHFSESDKDFFKEVAGQLLIDLGYETDMDW